MGTMLETIPTMHQTISFGEIMEAIPKAAPVFGLILFIAIIFIFAVCAMGQEETIEQEVCKRHQQDQLTIEMLQMRVRELENSLSKKDRK